MHSATARTGDEPKTEQSSADVFRVEPRNVIAAWPHLQGRLRSVLMRSCGDRITERELLSNLVNGGQELYLIANGGQIRAMVVLQFVKREAGTCCMVVALAGEDWRSWAYELQDFMVKRTTDCYCVEAYCRGGVAKILQDHFGWREKARLMEVRYGRSAATGSGTD